jgi:hypothetical protein
MKLLSLRKLQKGSDEKCWKVVRLKRRLVPEAVVEPP